MARKNIIRQSDFPYHVYSRSNNRYWFKIPLYRMWDLCFECFEYGLKFAPVNIHCFVLMNNHYHLLITTPNRDLDKFMQAFNRKLSQSINREARVSNHKFANGYKWTIIDSESYLHNIYRYIYQNPIRAKLCQFCLDYPYSSLRYTPSQVKKIKLSTHIDYFQNRAWMEHRNGDEFDKTIKKALHKRTFRVSSNERTFIIKSLKKKAT